MVELEYLAFQLMKTLESDWDYKASRARTSYLINFKLERTARQTEASGPKFFGLPLQANPRVIMGLDYTTTRTLSTGLIISELERTTADKWAQLPWPSTSSKFWGGSRLLLQDYMNTTLSSHYFQIGEVSVKLRPVDTAMLAFFWKERKVDSRRGLQNYESAFHSIPLLQTKRGLLETETTRTRPYPSFHWSKGWKGWYKTETSQLLGSSSGGREDDDKRTPAIPAPRPLMT